MAGFADGVIVGSAFVRRLLAAADLGDGRGPAAVADLAAELAAGVRAPRLPGRLPAARVPALRRSPPPGRPAAAVAEPPPARLGEYAWHLL